MSLPINLKDLHVAARLGNIVWQRHSLERILERNITRDQVIKTILIGEIIENYPDDTPFPSALFFSLIESRPLHAVIAFDSRAHEISIITVYEADLTHFQADFKTRRKP